MPSASSTLIPNTFTGFILGSCLIFLPTVVHSTTNSAHLQWAANSEADLAGYHVYQGTITGSYGPPIEVGNVTTYTAENLQPGLTYYYAVTAYDTTGNESPPSAEVSKFIEDSSSVDVTPPSVTVTSPTHGTTLSGAGTVSAAATDNIGVVGVQFQLNGTNLGAEDTNTPFSVFWDTHDLPPGQYTLTAIARDVAGNSTSSDPVQVTQSASSSTLSVSVVGNGNVTSSPAGIYCTSGTCSTSYQVDSTVTLVATAGRKGWNFVGWNGACTGTGECVIQLSSDQFVNATFSKGTNGNGNGGGGNGNGKKK